MSSRRDAIGESRYITVFRAKPQHSVHRFWCNRKNYISRMKHAQPVNVAIAQAGHVKSPWI